MRWGIRHETGSTGIPDIQRSRYIKQFRYSKRVTVGLLFSGGHFCRCSAGLSGSDVWCKSCCCAALANAYLCRFCCTACSSWVRLPVQAKKVGGLLRVIVSFDLFLGVGLELGLSGVTVGQVLGGVTRDHVILAPWHKYLPSSGFWTWYYTASGP